MSEALEHIKAHDDVLTALNETVDAMNEATEAANQAITELGLHNSDPESHPDLRRRIDALEQANGGQGPGGGGVTSEELEQHKTDIHAHKELFDKVKANINKVEQNITSSSTQAATEEIGKHNKDPQAHKELFDKLNKKIEKLEGDITHSGSQNVTEAIRQHNTSPTSHQDIRDKLTELSGKLDGSDVTTISKELERIKGLVDKTLPDKITNLESKDAKQDSTLSQHGKDIDDLKSKMDDITAELDVIVGGDFTRQEDIDSLILRLKEIELSINLCLKTCGEGPSFLGFTHTLPHYVGVNSTVKFTVKGAKQKAGGDNVEYSVEPRLGGFTLSPTTGIANNAEITLVKDGTGKPGDICYFVITAKDKNTQQTSQRVVAFMITRPISLKHISLRNYLPYAEPGHVFPNVSVRNLACPTGCKRWTYSLDPLQSGLQFAKINGGARESSALVQVNTDEEFKITVPASAERGTRVTFRVIVHDKYGPDSRQDFELSINSKPGSEKFNHNVPKLTIPGQTYQVKFWGMTSVDMVPAEYKITEEQTGLTFSKKTGIVAMENVSMTIASSATRGSKLTFKVIAVDRNRVETSFKLTVAVNQLPGGANITHTLPATSAGGKQITFAITGGGTDAEDPENIKYFIDTNGTGLTFSKTEGIAKNESITVTLPKVSSNTDKTINIHAVDSMEEKSTDKKVATIQIQPRLRTAKPTITSPSNGASVSDSFTMRFSAYATEADV